MKNKQEVEYEYMLKKMEIRHKILDYVLLSSPQRMIDTIIFAIPELQGKCKWPANIGNVFYTFKISPMGLECFQTLLKRKQIQILSANEYQCMLEGYYPYPPNMIAHPKRKGLYKEPRWQPAVVVITARGAD
jgi:hypothetical protein